MRSTFALEDLGRFDLAPLSLDDLRDLQGGTDDGSGGDGGDGHDGGPGRWCLKCVLGRCGRGPLEFAALAY